MKFEDIFRDTKNWYKCRSNYASSKLIDFAIRYAGDTILDAGCATGDYMQSLCDRGYTCAGVDINSEYVAMAKLRGLNAHVMNAKHLDFPDKSFDTLLLFEVLEHVSNPEDVLSEARRVAKKNVLITVPNCTQFHILGKSGLTYNHMLEKDHINFFTKSDLESMLSKNFTHCLVWEDEPIFIGNIGLPRAIRWPVSLLYKLRVLSPEIYFRLYAVAR